MCHILYDRFFNLYRLLTTVPNEILVLDLLNDLEHHKLNPKDKITYSESIKSAMARMNITRMELIHRVEALTHDESTESAINSLLYRNTCNSWVLPFVMEVLDIDEDYLIRHSSYFYPNIYNLQRNFETLSLHDQKVLINFLAHIIASQPPRRIRPNRKTTKISRVKKSN